jgi:hypothetical protein
LIRFERGQGGFGDGKKSPVILITGTFPDPALEESNLGAGEGISLFGWGHDFVRII